MKLKELYVKNFCCFDEFTLPLDEQGLVLLHAKNKDTESASANGAGKSTVFKALTWGLYGDTIDGVKGDKVVMDGQLKATVKVTFQDESGEWTVVRERKKGSPKVFLLQPDKNSFDASKGDIQHKINEMVGLDFHAFKNTVLFGQNDSSRFANPKTKDSDRKRMLHRILRTDIYEQCHKFALEKRKVVKDQIIDKEKELVSPAAKLEEINLEYLQKLSDDFEEKRHEQIRQHLERVKEYKEAAHEQMEKAKERDEIYPDYDVKKAERKIKRLAGTLKKAGDIEEKLEIVQEQIDEEKEEIADLEKEIYASEAELTQYKKRLRELDRKTCPVCTSDLSGGEAASYIDDLKDKAEQIEERIEAYTEEKAEIEYKLRILTDEKRKVQSALVKVKDIEEKLETLEDEKYEIEKARLSEDQRCEEAKEKARELANTARNYLKLAKEQEEIENFYKNQLEEQSEKAAIYQSEIEQITKLIGDLTDELSYFEFWVHGFSNQGLPSYILDNIMPFLTERANTYLLVLADGDIKVNFSTLKEMKSRDGKKDEIEITWEIEGYEGYPPSGGQQRKIEIATDFALMDLVATKEGGCIDLLALDEILDGLDDEGTKRVILLLETLKKHRGSIFVISHTPEVAESFEKLLMVTKENGVSRLERVA